MSPRARFKVLGLSTLILFALTSASASAAQIEAEWAIGAKPLAAYRVFEQPANWSAGKTLTLSVPWYATEIKCTTQSSGASLYPEGRSASTIVLSSCAISGPPFVAETCKLVQPINLSVAGDAVAHGGKRFSVFTSQVSGQPIAKVKFEKGTECPLPLENTIGGSFVAEHESGERVTQTLTLSEAVDKLLPTYALTFGTHPASLHGEAALTIPGEEEWGLVAPPWELGGKFLVNGSPIAGTKSFNATLSEGDLLTTGGVGFHCSSAVAVGNLLVSGALQGEALFENCEITEVPFCHLYLSESDAEENKNPDPDVLIEVSGELMSLGKERFLRFKGHPFTELWTGGELCPLPLEVNMSGSVAFKITNASVSQKTHTIEPINVKTEEALGVVPFFFDTEPATFEKGLGLIKLNTEENWSIQ